MIISISDQALKSSQLKINQLVELEEMILMILNSVVNLKKLAVTISTLILEQEDRVLRNLRQ